MTVSGFDGVDKHAKPEKSLLEVLKKHSGRNSYGRITVRHQGGGNRQKYRVIDFKRNKLDVAAKVLRLEYDPNRSAFIALCEYEDGERRYILAPVGLNPGDTIVSSAAADIKAGKVPDITIESSWNDPNGSGEQRIAVKHVKFEKVTLMDWEAGSIGEESYSFTFSDYEVKAMA